jgi:hypothetical protein
MTDLVATMRAYAAEHFYTDSWDVVTCWSDAQLRSALGGAKTRRGAISNVWQTVKVVNATRGANGRPVKPVSLFQFLAKRGGLKPHPELAVILDGNPFVGGVGRLLRQTGMELDTAREAAVEAGYLYDTPWSGGVAVSTINELLEALSREAAGQRVYTMWGDADDLPPAYDPNLTEETYDDIADTF